MIPLSGVSEASALAECQGRQRSRDHHHEYHNVVARRGAVDAGLVVTDLPPGEKELQGDADRGPHRDEPHARAGFPDVTVTTPV